MFTPSLPLSPFLELSVLAEGGGQEYPGRDDCTRQGSDKPWR